MIGMTRQIVTSLPTYLPIGRRQLMWYCGSSLTGGSHLGYVLLHGQVVIQMEAEIADDRSELDFGQANLN